MDSRLRVAAGGSSLVGAALAVLVNVPAGWYGLTARDSYVFEPAVLSPLWIERELVPVLSVLAVVGLLAGLVGLAARDWSVAGRSRRIGWIGAGLALAGLLVAVPTVQTATGGGALVALVGLALGALSIVVLAPSLALLAYGHALTERPVIGYAFAGVLVGVPVLGFLAAGALQGLAAVLPVAAAWSVVGADLLRHSGPLGREASTGA